MKETQSTFHGRRLTGTTSLRPSLALLPTPLFRAYLRLKAHRVVSGLTNDGVPVSSFADTIFERLSCLVEEVVVHGLQRQMLDGISLTELPLAQRGAEAPERFQPAIVTGGSVIWRITYHGGWKEIGKRTKVLYTVDFASIENQPLGTSKGTCWDDALTKCADKIVKDAAAVARKVHQD